MFHCVRVCVVVLVTAAAQAFIGYLRDIKSGAAGSRETQNNDATAASVNVREIWLRCAAARTCSLQSWLLILVL